MKISRFWTVVVLLAGTGLILHARGKLPIGFPRERALIASPKDDCWMEWEAMIRSTRSR